MNKFLSIICLTGIVSGCTMQPSMPLSEQLKTDLPVERQETLGLACLNGAEHITGRTSMWKTSAHHTTPVYDSKVEQMKGLCREMTMAYLAPDQAHRDNLAKESEVFLQSLEVTQRNADAIKNMRNIYKIMTNPPKN